MVLSIPAQAKAVFHWLFHLISGTVSYKREQISLDIRLAWKTLRECIQPPTSSHQEEESSENTVPSSLHHKEDRTDDIIPDHISPGKEES